MRLRRRWPCIGRFHRGADGDRRFRRWSDVAPLASAVLARDLETNEGDANAENRGPFVRSFGRNSTDGAASAADVKWRIAKGNTGGGRGGIGQWGIRMAALLSAEHEVPLGLVNGALGGQPIGFFERNDENPVDPATNYGRLLARAQAGSLDQDFRAILWYQGESDGAAFETHQAGFVALTFSLRPDVRGASVGVRVAQAALWPAHRCLWPRLPGSLPAAWPRCDQDAERAVHSGVVRHFFSLWLVFLLFAPGCVTARNFADPRQRITDHTAYSLTNRETRVDVGVLGTDLSDAGATLGVAAGFARGGEVSTNLAHGALGIVNGSLKYNVLDRPWFGLGFQGTFLWTRPDLIWLLPASVQDPIDRVNLFIIPMRAIASFPVAHWTSLHLGAGYVHAEVLGPVSAGPLAFEGGLGSRKLFVEPGVHFYLANKVALVGGAHLPLASWGRENIAAEIELEPGVIAGIRSSEWARLPLAPGIRWRVGGEVRFGKRTHVQLFATRGFLRAIGIGPRVLPALNVYWRI